MRLSLMQRYFQLFMLGAAGIGLFNSAVLAADTTVSIPADHYMFQSLQSSAAKIPSDAMKIFQDSQGYIWLGTFIGIYRHDGYALNKYRDDRDDEYRLSVQYIYDITEDSSGNLWIATKKGLTKLNLKSHETTHFLSVAETSTSDRDKGAISDNRIPVLLLDGNRLLIGTAKGLDAINLNTEVISPVLSGYHVRSLSKGLGDTLWIGTAKNGLLKYNENSNSVKRFSVSGNQGDDSSFIRKMALLKNDLWLGTEDGVYQFDTQTESFKKSLLTGARIMEIAIESEHILWLATLGRGLYRYYLEGNTLKHFAAHQGDRKSLGDANILSIFMDRSHKRLWAGSQSGVYFLDLSKPVYLMRHQLPSKGVWSIAGSHNNDLLIGTDKGLSIYNAESSTIRHHEIEGAVYAIASDHDKIWLGGDYGFYALEKASKKLSYLTPGISFLANKSNQIIVDIGIHSQDQILMASGFGLIHWDRRAQDKTNFTYNGETDIPEASNFITSMHRHNSTWVAGTQYGLFFVDFNQKKLKRYLHNEQLTLLDKTHIASFISDDHSNLWVSTDDGLFKLNEHKIIAHYNAFDGLPDRSIHNMTIDGNRLWASTDNGVIAFQIDDQKVKLVHLNNDSFNIEFNTCDLSQPNNGYLYFCSADGVFYFDPKLFSQSAAPPRALITGFRLFNRPQVPGSKWLPQSIEYTDRLILDYQQNMLSFEFSALNYSQAKHLYAYQMLGITKEDEWIITDSQNRMATFTAQNPGDYTFRIKAGWDEKTWSDEITQLKVTILPPWWQSTTAYGFYLFAFLMSIILIIKVRTGRLHKQAMVLKQEVAERTEEIQGLLEKKNELFANVSHELRTPLTLILGPADRSLRRDQDEKTKNDLQLIKRSGQRLRALVEQLLLFSKLSHFELLEAKPCSVRKTTQVIGASMASLMDENQLALEMDSIPDVWVKLSPEDALQTILINLLSNAVKYTPAGGKIKISINIIDEAQVRIMIADSGPGIPEEWFDKIFERFSRLPQHAKSNISGTGLGLPMVKDLVEMNGGDIRVSNAKAGGALFAVVFPSYQPTTEERENGQIMDISSIEPVRKDSLMASSNTWQAAQQDIEKSTLLVIDDTADMRTYIASELSHEFNVLLAENGEQGLQLIEQQGPDLIVCDVMMPGIDGFEVLRRLRADINISHIPLILLTAKDGKENRMKGFEGSADDYIVKPFEMDELKVRIKNILDLRKLWREQAKISLLGTVDEKPGPVQNYAKTEKRFLEKFKTILDENYQSSDLDIETICDQLHLSQSTLNRKIKALLGSSPYQYLRIYRLQKAAQMLRSGYQGNLAQLADAMGFSSQQHFASSFKDYFGVTPKDYRE